MNSVSTCSKEKSEAKLPRLELPKFSGELTDWQAFWDRFEALVDQSELPVISKFSYLQSLLKGEALSVIQGLALTNANYTVARKLLKARFGRPEKIIFAHVQRLLNASLTPRVKGTNYIDSLWKLQGQLLRHVRSLKGLGISSDQYGVVLTPVFLSRLPQEIRLEWSRASVGHEGDLEWLLRFLQKEIMHRERSETFKELSVEKNNPRWEDVGRRKIGSASALQTTSEEGPLQCVLCQTLHKSEKCWHFLRLDRRVTLPQLELLGALLSARLISFVKSALRLSNDVKLVCWTDSKVALSWIVGNLAKWRMFVANRVTEIQTLTSPGNWFHCPVQVTRLICCLGV